MGYYMTEKLRTFYVLSIKGRNFLTVDLGPPKSATEILRTNDIPDRGVMQPKIELNNFSY